MFLKVRQYLDFNKTKYHEKIINIEEIKQAKVPIKVFDVEISYINFKKEEKCIQS